MFKKTTLILCSILYILLFLPNVPGASPSVKIAVLNFGTLNLEAAGYGTAVTNMIIASLKSSIHLNLMERKELEAFLRMNDLQQNDDIENVVYIGNRLGLYAIVAGTVKKEGAVLTIHCNVFKVDEKKAILKTVSRAIGQMGLNYEVTRINNQIRNAIRESLTQQGAREKKKYGGPVNIEARAGGKSKIYLVWQDPPGQKSAGYKIFRSMSKTGPFAKIAQVKKNEYLDQYLTHNTPYYYKLRSYDSRGRQSKFSEIISAETAPTPNPPIILKTESHIQSIEITWAPSPAKSDDPQPLNGYRIYRADQINGSYNKVADILGRDIGMRTGTKKTMDKSLKVNYTDRNLTDGKEYFYKLTAYNTKNLESDFSTSVKGTTIPTVSNLSARGDMIREIELVWDREESPHVQGYYVYRSINKDKDFHKIKKISQPTLGRKKQIRFVDDMELADKVAYYYYVTVFESSDMETSPSITVSATTRGKPPAVKGLKAKSGMVKQIELTWKANEQEEVKGYIIYRSDTIVGTYVPVETFSGRTKNRFINTGLNDSTTYCYRITTYNKVKVESIMSNGICAVTKSRPTKPQGLKGNGLQVKRVPLAWLPNPEKDIACYHVYRSSDSGLTFSQVMKVEGRTSCIDKDLEDGKEYCFKIKAVDKNNLMSDLSDSIVVRTKPIPEEPKGLEARSAEGKIFLSWKRNAESDIKHYTVYEKILFILKEVATVTSNNATISGIPPGKEKTYVVRAVDSDGLVSEPSHEITVIVK
jgi:fibronectin type 3 domain-containing protein